MSDTATIDCTRGLFTEIEVREIDDDARTAKFVAATEKGVQTHNGLEYLRLSGLELKRYRANPVVLDTHNRWEAGAVIGKASVRTEKRELIADITFAETERAETVWQLVRTRFLNALSIGFGAVEVQNVPAGEFYGTGANRVEGPARVVKRSELYEVSVVPVPADADSLRRSFLHGEPVELAAELRALRRQLDEFSKHRELDMAKDKTGTEPETRTAETPPAAPSGDTNTNAPPAEELAEERSARLAEARRREIHALTPRGLEAVADQCVAEGCSVEDARKRILAAQAERTKPAGTPDAPPPAKNPVEADGEPAKVADVSDDVFLRSLTG